MGLQDDAAKSSATETELIAVWIHEPDRKLSTIFVKATLQIVLRGLRSPLTVGRIQIPGVTKVCSKPFTF